MKQLIYKSILPGITILLLLLYAFGAFAQADSLQVSQTEDNTAIIALYALMLLGLFIQTAISAQKFLADGTYLFSYWLRRNIFNFLIGLGCGIFFIYARYEFVSAVGFKPKDGDDSFILYAFTAGYLGREWLYQVIQIYKNVNKPKV